MNQKLSCNEAFPLAFLRGNSYDSHNMETCVRVVRTEHLQCSLNQNRLAHRVSCHTEHLQCSLNQNRLAHRVSCHTEHLQCSLNQNRLVHRVSCHTEHLQCSLNQNRPAHRVSCHTEKSSAWGASAEKELSAPMCPQEKGKEKDERGDQNE